MTGVIAMGFSVDKLFNDHLKPLEFDGNMVFVTGLDGDIEICKDHSLIKRGPDSQALPPIPPEIKALGYHGHWDWKAPDGKDYLIIYHPVTMTGRTMVAQLRIPCDDISQFVKPFYWKHSILMIFLSFIALVAICISILTGKRLRQMERQICALEIQIDEERKRKSVEEITGSVYFQSIQKQAKALKELDQ